MKKSTRAFGFAGICAVGVLSGFGISYSAKEEIKRLEQLPKVQEYCTMNEYVRQTEHTIDKSSGLIFFDEPMYQYQTVIQTFIERRDVLLQDPTVQEYLERQTWKGYGDTTALASSGLGAIALMIAFYQRRREL